MIATELPRFTLIDYYNYAVNYHSHKIMNHEPIEGNEYWSDNISFNNVPNDNKICKVDSLKSFKFNLWTISE